MFKRVLLFLALAFALFGAQGWAATCFPGEEATSCMNTFSPVNTTNTYDFSGSGDGILIVQFTNVLSTFNLTVTFKPATDPIDPSEFPAGTTYVQYSNSNSDQYNFTGNAGGPNGVPVRNKDYKGLISLILSYDTSQVIDNPAFGHAPGDSTTFTEDILTGFSTPPVEDPHGTMTGTTPGLSSVAALNELTENDTFCWSPQPNPTYTAGQEFAVAFQLFSGACNSGTPIRDKTARLSLALTDSSGDFISSATLQDKEEGNKFHWVPKKGVNEFDLSTEGLAPGNFYTITLFSSKFPAQSVTFYLMP